MHKPHKKEKGSGESKKQLAQVVPPKVEVSIIHGQKSLFINGKLMEPYEDNGVVVPYSLIRDLEIKELNQFKPIIITYSKKNIKDPNLKEFFNLNTQPEFVLEVSNEISVEAFVTVMDGFDDELHEEYQLKLEEIVKENPELTTYGNVHDGFDKMVEMQEEVENMNEEEGIDISYSPVGFVQFSVTISGFVFKDIYPHLIKLLDGLDKETMRRIDLE